MLACAGGLVWPSAAFGQSASDDLARRHFDSGVAYLEESDYENALRAFEKAYELSQRPAILLNIATVQERRGDLKAAITALDGYLQAEPNGEHAETTRLRIDNLQKRLAAEEPPPPPKPAPPPAVVQPAPPPPAPPPQASHRSSGARVAGFIVLGAGGVSAVTAVITGILANSEYQSAKDECSPRCPDSEVSKGENLAWVSTIATGVAVLGVGIGTTLILTSPSGSASSAPVLQVGFGPSGPSARASVRF